ACSIQPINTLAAVPNFPTIGMNQIH
ncbi:MAG: hypothetical protein RL168_144, partial [Bacteroidota bacterium]